MKFYGRKKELEELEKLFAQIKYGAKMVVLTGRRRVGKTLLALKFTEKHKFIYLFVAKKSEQLLCNEYLEEIKKNFKLPIIGEIKSFKEIFTLLLEIAKQHKFILIIDEFQIFYQINPAVFSDMQHLWDLNKDKCNLQLILAGSVYSIMHKIFENEKEPLFGRADRIMHIKPFSIKTINNILKDHGSVNIKTLFDYYNITGGLAKYIDVLITNKALSYNKIIKFILSANSPFLNEGKNLLIEEFGKEYVMYFSILELISVGKTARSAIESILQKNIGGYLDRLENDYSLIAKYRPINAKPNSKLQKYRIVDNFLCFWFRFIYRNRTAVEANNFAYIEAILKRDYPTYCGLLLERAFADLFMASGLYNKVGNFWEKDYKNEIDLVAINDLNKKIVIADIKLDKNKINIPLLKEKGTRLLECYAGYNVQWLGLSLHNITDYL